MWQWLRAKLPKRITVLGRLWLVSCGIHALIFLVVWIAGNSKYAPQALSISGGRRLTDARIVLIPSLKTVKNTSLDRPVKGTKFGVAATQKPTATKKVTKTALKKTHKAPEKKGTTTMLAQLDVAKKSKVTSAKKEDQQKKKKPQEKQKQPEKTVPKKAEEKPPVVAKNEAKIEEPKKEEPLLGDPLATDEVIYVGRDDLHEMQTQHVVADALQKQWQAPSGIAADTLCHIAFEVDKEGRACNVTMKQQSKVLIFDVAARTAVVQAHFSQAAYGRQFIVAFKP